MSQDYGMVHLGVKVFKIFAWISVVLQGLIGLFLLFGGGEPVPIGGADVPVRLFSLLYFLAAAIYFFLFMFMAGVTRLLLDLHGRSGGSSS